MSSEIKSDSRSDELPKVITACVTSNIDGDKNEEQVESAAAVKITNNNPAVNLSERDKIANDVLAGEEIEVPTSGKVIQQPHKDLKRNASVESRYHSKHNFLELRSAPVTIHDTPVIEDMEKYKKRTNTHTQSFTWANDYIPASGAAIKIARESELKVKRDRSDKVISIIKAQSESKELSRSRNIEEVKNIREESTKKKAEYKSIKHKSREEKKLIEEIRRQLYQRLKEKNDPLMGPIMRCIDDSLLFQFVHQFKGYTMSVDAIIALLGKSLGSDSEEQRKIFAKSVSYAPEDVNLNPDTQPYPNVGYGLRSPTHPAAPRPGSPHFVNYASNESIAASMGAKPSGGGGASASAYLGTDLPDRSRSPPRAAQWGINHPQYKRLGSGYRSSAGPPMRDYGGLLLSSPNSRASTAHRPPVRLIPTNTETEEQVPRFGRKLDYKSTAEQRNPSDDWYKMEIDDEFEEERRFSYSTVGNAVSKTGDYRAPRPILALRSQQLEEGRLPSLQAEKVFSDEAMNRIGSAPNKKGEIADMIINRKPLAKRTGARDRSLYGNSGEEQIGGTINNAAMAKSSSHTKIMIPSPGAGTPSRSNTNATMHSSASISSSIPYENGIPRGVKMQMTSAAEVDAPRGLKTQGGSTTHPVHLYKTPTEQSTWSQHVIVGAKQ